LLALVLLLITSAIYSVHRYRAFAASDQALAEVRAELDKTEPGWRYEDIEAAHNVTRPPAEKNSFRLIENFPQVQQRPPHETLAGTQLAVAVFQQQLGEAPTNELPFEDNCKFTDAIAADIPADHPIIRALVRSPTGWVPIDDDFRLFHPSEPLEKVRAAGELL